MSASHALTLPARGRGGAPTDATVREGRGEAKRILARGSKSFALAGALLGRRTRDDAAVLYAWCRRADDRIDDACDSPSHGGELAQALEVLRAELDALYAGQVTRPMDVALAELIERRRIPRAYFQDLLDGFAMDAEGRHYATLDELDLYGYRVAGVVGLMMCHVLGVRDDRCLRAAARLGMAMQLTNIARDVAEDLARGRQYLPSNLVSATELSLATTTGDARCRGQVADGVRALLGRADGYYRDGLAGLSDLGWRDALAIGAAARIYRAIGQVLARRGFDALAGRAVVSLPRKLWLTLGAGLTLLRRLPARLLRGRRQRAVPNMLARWNDVRA
jgi:phytoene synthase